MSTERKMQVARAQLLLNHPFFGMLAMRLHLVESLDFDTAATDGRNYYYNPKFMESLPAEHRLTITAHEVLHCVLEHMTRRGSRNPILWNVAGDYVINLLLRDSGFRFPPGALLDTHFANLSTEAVYDMLLKELPPELKKRLEVGDDPGGMGQVLDAPGKSETTTELAEDWKQSVAAAATLADGMGKLPASLARLVGRLLNPMVPWQALLRDFLHEPFKGDYTWKRPNKRYAHAGLHFPTIRTDCTGEIVVAIDTSGSINDDMLTRFFSEVYAIFSEVKPSALHIIYCDSVVNRVDVYRPGDIPEPHPCGGGGTSFVPPFDYLEQNGIVPAAFVYLTDLQCNSYPTTPTFPLLWACWEENYPQPPFGQVINVN